MSKILMVASEGTPFAKTGGLADVIGALPKALAARGERVAVVMPLYSAAGTYPSHLATAYHDLPVWFGGTSRIAHIRTYSNEGVDYYFVDEPSLFDRPSLYGEGGVDYPDNHIRFGVLCHAALSVVRHLFRPDVIHCHDWQTGLIGPLMRHQFRLDPTFLGVRLLMTIHNIGYQGVFPPVVLRELGMDPGLLRPDLLEFWGNVNMLKAGLVFSDAISTVSPTYAREIQTPEFGFGLDGLLRARSSDLTGILNGVDYSEWSPENDEHICCRYSVDQLGGKRECKRDLLASMGLDAGRIDKPLIGMVSRFVHQKGFDILTEVADEIAQEDVTVVALGSGVPEFEAAMEDLATRYPDNVAVRLGYDNALSHRIEAGSDMFLMPSHYEPCGLNQIYSLRYGTLPIVRATGGLDDTVDAQTGFKFAEYTGAALLRCVREALTAYGDKRSWARMMDAAMRRDFSWNASAGQYGALYEQLRGGAARGTAA